MGLYIRKDIGLRNNTLELRGRIYKINVQKYIIHHVWGYLPYLEYDQYEITLVIEDT